MVVTLIAESISQYKLLAAPNLISPTLENILTMNRITSIKCNYYFFSLNKFNMENRDHHWWQELKGMNIYALYSLLLLGKRLETSRNRNLMEWSFL